MDFSISPEIKKILERINRFVDDELIPLEPDFLKDSADDVDHIIEEKRLIVKSLGLWAPNHPAEYGGMGLNLMAHALVSEALGRSPLGHPVFGCQAPDAGNIEILHKYGTDEQKDKFLGPLVAGELRSCFSMTEVEQPGSNPILMDTKAVKDGNEYVISGRKWYATAADGADFSIVMAITDPDADSPYLKASMIIVPTDTAGFELVRNIPVMGHAGGGYFSHGEIVYKACRVPRSNLLGPEGQGFVIAQERLGPGRIQHCMRWIGICNRAFEMMCSRAIRRRISPEKTLAAKQIIQSWIAECAADIQSARLMVLHTAWMIENLGAKEARQQISLIKFKVAGVMQNVIDKALQVHGGLGMTDDTILAFYYRHERAARIYDGADEVHKISVARRILREHAVNQSG